jgi:phospholipid/cholesterol/gamma-HCH transport system substrate-binding protein
MGKSLSAAVSDLQQATGRMSRPDNTLGKLLTERELYDTVARLTGRLDELAGNLNSGRGTAGLLLQDRALYENMNRTVTELRELLADIRKDPKKFLRVNVSIF